MSFDDDEAEVEYEVESFIIHSHEFHLTTISYMPIERLVDLQAQSKEISGQKLWCRSLCLMEYLTDFPHTVSGKNVLELGAGTGVVGMLCDKLGSRSGTTKKNFSSQLCLISPLQLSSLITTSGASVICAKTVQEIMCGAKFMHWIGLTPMEPWQVHYYKGRRALPINCI